MVQLQPSVVTPPTFTRSMSSSGGPLIVVVGAGVSGLATLKSCLEQGLNAVCFEKSDSIGGLWQFKENAMSCTKTTLFNTSKEWSAFSDFPMPEHFPNYLNHKYYTEYLRMFADKFDLHRHIYLEHQILKVHRAQSYHQTGEWIVKIRNIKEDKDMDITAAKVAMCVGVFLKSNIPAIKGIESFQGHTAHSMDFKYPNEYENKRVVVIGSGNTAADTAVEIGRVASKVYLGIRQGVVVLGRIGHMGYPIDMQVFKRLPVMLKSSKSDPFKEIFLKGWYQTQTMKVDKKMYQFSDEGFNGRAPVVINDELPLNVFNGNVTLKNPVRHITPNGVVFEGEENKVYDIDAIVLATGYRVPDKGIVDDLAVTKDQIYHGLYKRVFPVQLPHPTLAFIGYVRVHGPNAQIIELQARWVAQVFDKQVKLPSKEHMENFIAKEEKDGVEKASEHTLLRDYYPFADQLAEEFGAKPNLFRLFLSDFRLFWAVSFGPMLAYHYRLNGPHKWSGARNAILTVDDRIRSAFKTRPPNQLDIYGTNNYSVGHWALFSVAMTTAFFALVSKNQQWAQSALTAFNGIFK
ncbi:millipede aldoxime synthase [Chamberlinius hualienensis]